VENLICEFSWKILISQGSSSDATSDLWSVSNLEVLLPWNGKNVPWGPSTGIPRVRVAWPFPPPVFDHLQYANTEGEDLGDLVTCGYVR